MLLLKPQHMIGLGFYKMETKDSELKLLSVTFQGFGRGDCALT